MRAAKVINYILIAIIATLLFGFFYYGRISNVSPTDLAGQDLNNNGVRDDVDVVVESMYPTDSLQKQGAYKYAQILQIMITNPANANNLVGGDGNGKLFLTFDCIGTTNAGKISDATLNNSGRKHAYDKASQTFPGGGYSLRKSDEACTDLVNDNNTSGINTTASVVNALITAFTKQGYTVNRDGVDTLTYVWWKATDRLAVYIPATNALSFDITKSAPDDYNVQDMTSNPDIAKVVTTINSYMAEHEIDLQSDQSSGSNPKIQSFTYTNSYFDTKTLMRCRLQISNPDAGVGEVAPFRFSASLACAHANAYQTAYDGQLPYFDALTKYLNSTSSALYMLNPTYTKTCKNDPAIKPLEIYGIGESSVNYMYVKKVNNVWVDSGLSGYQAGQHCGSIS